MKLPSILGALLFCALLPGQYACYLTESCDDLQTSAEHQVLAVADQNLSCASDADCIVTRVDADGACAAVCGILTNTASAAAVASAASSACGDFRAKGCSVTAPGCFGGSEPLCSAGTCM